MKISIVIGLDTQYGTTISMIGGDSHVVMKPSNHLTRPPYPMHFFSNCIMCILNHFLFSEKALQITILNKGGKQKNKDSHIKKMPYTLVRSVGRFSHPHFFAL